MQLRETQPAPSAARKRAAVELIARDGAELRRTARRYSLCEEDAEDACQRALEILLLKAPSERPRELIRWTKTVVKHEALAIRRHRERLLGSPPPGDTDEDPTASIPARGEGPEARAESREHLARSREALRTLKPAELRALTLLAAGYSYAEIGEITGFSRTKVNRCLAEGRERFRSFLADSEDGSRCAEMAPLLSAFCDGEASAEEAAAVREHLRACVACRAALRAYRATPDAIAALAPVLPALPAARSLLERGRELFHDLVARLPGTGGAADGAGVAVAGGASGAGAAGAAGAAKLLAVCAGTVGAAACVATGVAPTPLDLAPEQRREPRIERVAEHLLPAPSAEPAEGGPPLPEPEPVPQAESKGAEATEPAPSTGAVEYEPAPAPAPEPEPAPASPPASPPPPSGSSSGSAAGEFGP